MSWIVCHLLFYIIMKMKQHRAFVCRIKTSNLLSFFFFYNVHCSLLKDQDSSKNGCFVLDNVRKMWVQLSYTHIWAGKFDNIEMCTHLRRIRWPADESAPGLCSTSKDRGHCCEPGARSRFALFSSFIHYAPKTRTTPLLVQMWTWSRER